MGASPKERTTSLTDLSIITPKYNCRKQLRFCCLIRFIITMNLRQYSTQSTSLTLHYPPPLVFVPKTELKYRNDRPSIKIGTRRRTCICAEQFLYDGYKLVYRWLEYHHRIRNSRSTLVRSFDDFVLRNWIDAFTVARTLQPDRVGKI